MAEPRWTRQCCACLEYRQRHPDHPRSVYFVPDDRELCDGHLVERLAFGMLRHYDSCDQMGMGPRYYEEDDVLHILARFDNALRALGSIADAIHGAWLYDLAARKTDPAADRTSLIWMRDFAKAAIAAAMVPPAGRGEPAMQCKQVINEKGERCTKLAFLRPGLDAPLCDEHAEYIRRMLEARGRASAYRWLWEVRPMRLPAEHK